jgi:CheY-like chemotaxis protein
MSNLFSREVRILVAEDNPGHGRLIEKNLTRAGFHNKIRRFDNGQSVLDFLFSRGPGAHIEPGMPYLLLLNIRMPLVDGIEILRQLKADAALKKIPVIMLTTTDDPREVERCHAIGCAGYIGKPLDYQKFAEAIKSLRFYLALVEVAKDFGGETESAVNRDFFQN